MHSALEIAEIKHCIVDFCDDSSLAALSSTASLWTPFALDALYGQQIGILFAFYPLLFSKACREGGDEYVLDFPLSNPDLTSTKIERFASLYASRVRQIIYSPPDRPYLDREAQWIAVLSRQLPPIWFPQLWSVQIAGFYGALNQAACMPNLESSLPLLTSLAFSASTQETHDAWSRIIPSLPYLDTVHIWDVRHDETVNLWISAFSRLRQVPRLMSLSVSTPNSTVSYIPELFSVLSSLRTLVVLRMYEFPQTRRKPLSLECFEPLLQLRNLKQVSFYLTTNLELKDTDIEVMLLAWPRLISLRINGLGLTTIKTLVYFARHPALRQVEMYMDLAVELPPVVVPTTRSQNTSSQGLTSLTMVQPNFDGISYETLAMFISAIVPGVRRVVTTRAFSAPEPTGLEANTRDFNSALAAIPDNSH
ncbi:hypothetical protein DL96DRAFT_1631114 [Flagelloscypha sp. PMI_526]|nr:hypothetical protein DL96DRAFT_1631114 [Flagelloscypha sp. PMI_526]